MTNKSLFKSCFFSGRGLIALLLCAAAACSILIGTLPATAGKLAFFRPEAPPQVSSRTLTFEERVAYQRAIEEVYWRHRIWPKERPDPKPPLDSVMSAGAPENVSHKTIMRTRRRWSITGNGRLLPSSHRLEAPHDESHKAGRRAARTLCSARERPLCDRGVPRQTRAG